MEEKEFNWRPEVQRANDRRQRRLKEERERNKKIVCATLTLMFLVSFILIIIIYGRLEYHINNNYFDEITRNELFNASIRIEEANEFMKRASVELNEAIALVKKTRGLLRWYKKFEEGKAFFTRPASNVQPVIQEDYDYDSDSDNNNDNVNDY